MTAARARLTSFAFLACLALGLPAAAQPQDRAPFVADKPAAETQVQKSVEERGVNPCDTPDPGFGNYSHWEQGIGMGQFIMPLHGAVKKDGDFDVMIHFHGHEAARKEWVQVMDRAVLVGIDLGLGSGSYETAFQAPDVFPRLVDSIERAVAKKAGRKTAHARNIGLSAWSAGYGALQWILGQEYAKKRVDTVILLDGLHCGYLGPAINGQQIAPFTDFARLAADGERLMFVSHSSIIPPGYASTTETASYLIHEVGGKSHNVHGSGPAGMDLISRYSKGNFHVRGFSGNDKMDHCAQIVLYRDVLKVHVKTRWSARGRGE